MTSRHPTNNNRRLWPREGMMHDTPTQNDLLNELEAALESGELDLDRFDAEALGLDFDNLTVDDITLQTQLQTRVHAPLKSKLLHPRLIVHENAQALARELGPMAEPGSRAHAVVSGNFVFGDLLEAWIVANNWLVPDLYVATLSLSAENIVSLGNLLHGDYVQRLHLTVSDYWYSHERRDLVPFAYDELDLGGERFQLTVTTSHAKIILIETDQGARYVLHGSANLRSSASIEQIAIEHDPDLYHFHCAWLAELEAQYHTIHPQQPGNAAPKRKQWQAIQAANATKIAITPDPDRDSLTAPGPPVSGAPVNTESVAAPNHP